MIFYDFVFKVIKLKRDEYLFYPYETSTYYSIFYIPRLSMAPKITISDDAPISEEEQKVCEQCLQ